MSLSKAVLPGRDPPSRPRKRPSAVAVAFLGIVHADLPTMEGSLHAPKKRTGWAAARGVKVGKGHIGRWMVLTAQGGFISYKTKSHAKQGNDGKQIGLVASAEGDGPRIQLKTEDGVEHVFWAHDAREAYKWVTAIESNVHARAQDTVVNQGTTNKTEGAVPGPAQRLAPAADAAYNKETSGTDKPPSPLSSPSPAASPPQPGTPTDADARLTEDEACARLEADAPLPEGSHWEELGGHDIERLSSNTTVISVPWLIDFCLGKVMPERKGVMPPWQELPPEAKVSLQELREAATGPWYLPLGILSYGWEAKHHPDPRGHLLRRLLPALKSMVNGKDQPIIGIIWDFPSFPQRGYTLGFNPKQDDRTEYEQKRFDRGLSNINIPYAHPHVVTLVCDFDMPTGAENTHSIDVRGWCIFERCLGQIAKGNWCYVNLSLLPEDAERRGWRRRWM